MDLVITNGSFGVVFNNTCEICFCWMVLLLEFCCSFVELGGRTLLEAGGCGSLGAGTFLGLGCSFLAFLATGIPNLAGSVNGVAGKDIGGSVAALVLELVGVV